MMDISNGETFHLYTYFRSSSSARIRTAAHLKNIPVIYHYISLPNAENQNAEYGRLNPNYTVPTLIIQSDKNPDIIIVQSIAILEFLEEKFPDRHPLLPSQSDIAGRAHVRQLVNLVACDIQPPTNLRILKRVKLLGGNAEEWAKDIMRDGLLAFEALVATRAGRYCFGDELSLADVVLAPAIVNAVRYGVDLDEVPTIKRVSRAIEALVAFKLGDWKHQEDTPQQFRDI